MKETKETTLTLAETLERLKLMSKLYNKTKPKMKAFEYLICMSIMIEISIISNKGINKKETLYMLKAFLKEPIQTSSGEINYVTCITSQKQKKSKKVINSIAKHILNSIYEIKTK